MVNARLTKGELVLNEGQQNKFWGIVNGTYSGRIMDGRYNGTSNTSNNNIDGNLSTSIRGTDLAVVVKLGQQKNSKFIGGRG
jgi:hypothetical protein